MNGVEILSSAQVASEFAFNKPVFWIVFGVILGGCIIAGIILALEQCGAESLYIFSIFGLIFGIVCGTVIGRATEYPIAYETHYKVTIEDSVSMNEFTDKYEILDQEGKIYIVKEKE